MDVGYGLVPCLVVWGLGEGWIRTGVKVQKSRQKGLKKELLNSVGNNKLIIKTNECDFIIENGKLITVYA